MLWKWYLKEATTISDTQNLETKLVNIADTIKMMNALKSAGLDKISGIVLPDTVDTLAPPPQPAPPPPPAPDETIPKFLATPKAKNVVASEFEVEFKLDSDVDVYWLIIQGETNKVMENTLTPPWLLISPLRMTISQG